MKTVSMRTMIIAFGTMLVVMIFVFGLLYRNDRPPATVQAVTNAVKTVSRTPPRFIRNIEGPKDNPLNGPLGVAVAADGRVFVVDTGNDRIVVFDKDGKLLKHFGQKGGGDGEFRTPTSIAVGNDKLYVADLKNGFVKMFDLEGAFLGRLEADKPYAPVAVAVGADGRILVSDVSVQAVLVFSADGVFQTRFGGAGDAEGKLSYANGVFVDQQGRIFVADSNNARVQVFDREGKVLRQIGSPPSDDPSAANANTANSVAGSLVLPRGIIVDSSGRITVVDTLAHKINVYSEEGTFLFGFGDRGTENGQLLFPNGLAIDAGSRLYITDRDNGRVVVFGY